MLYEFKWEKSATAFILLMPVANDSDFAQILNPRKIQVVCAKPKSRPVESDPIQAKSEISNGLIFWIGSDTIFMNPFQSKLFARV